METRTKNILILFALKVLVIVSLLPYEFFAADFQVGYILPITDETRTAKHDTVKIKRVIPKVVIKSLHKTKVYTNFPIIEKVPSIKKLFLDRISRLWNVE